MGKCYVVKGISVNVINFIVTKVKKIKFNGIKEFIGKRDEVFGN